MRDDTDRTIDDVARRLTAGEPDAAFRVRVLARIEAGEARRAWRLRWALAPASIAAAIGIAITWAAVREHRSAPIVGAPRAAGQARVLLKPDAPAVGTPVRLVPDTRSEGPVRWKPDRTDARTPASEIDALAPPPIDVPSIALAPIDRGVSIQLRELAPIAPLEVAPLADPNPNENPRPPFDR
jgi:hypothetical protein